MKILANHTLDVARQRLLAWGVPMLTRRFLVIHFTGGWTAEGVVDDWLTRKARGKKQASAHIIIDRDGSVTQCHPFNQTAWHAGESAWKDLKTGITYHGLNSCSIGIELSNVGDLPRPTYPHTMPSEWKGQPIPRMTATHKAGDRGKWELYDARQIDTLTEVSQLLCAKYKLDDLIGHEDISWGRKNDPGPAFPMAELRRACGFSGPIPRLIL